MTASTERAGLTRMTALHARRARRLHTELQAANLAVTQAGERCEASQRRLADLRLKRRALIAWKRRHAGSDALRWRDTLREREAGLAAALRSAGEALQQAARAYEEAVAERNRIARAYRRNSERETDCRMQRARLDARLQARTEERAIDDMTAARGGAVPALLKE